MTVRSLPSYWRGVRFRSRTEARWASWFDDVGWHWQYEPEGFALEDGTCYLPDFLVTTHPISEMYWLEVKPPGCPTPAEISKLEKLCIGTGRDGAFLLGPPGLSQMPVFFVERGGWMICHLYPEVMDGARWFTIWNTGRPDADTWDAEVASASDWAEPYEMDSLLVARGRDVSRALEAV